MPLPSFSLFKGFSVMQWALGISIAVHAVLLSVRFVAPEAFNRVFEDTPLEVILVNAKSQNEKPNKAQAMAQANLAGGGESAANLRATSPLPPSPADRLGDAFEEAQRKIDVQQEQQMALLAQVRQQVQANAAVRTDASQPSEGTEQEAKQRQLVKMLAEIERRIQEENARPRKRYISPATTKAEYAIYYDALRHRIETKGTENFPQVNGQKLYGELILVITINHDGSVLDVKVHQPSGNPALDKRAVAIARSAGGFGIFTSDLRKLADQLVVVTRFRFQHDDSLATDKL